jgi:hypothetical protein
MHSMFEEFSSSYYFGRLYVTPSEGDEPVMQREQHERVAEQLYHDGSGLTRVDSPLVMKLDTAHLAVRGEDWVPADTLAVPASILERTAISNPPELTEVFLAKADRAPQLLQFTGYDEGEPDDRFDVGPNAGT